MASAAALAALGQRGTDMEVAIAGTGLGIIGLLVVILLVILILRAL